MSLLWKSMQNSGYLYCEQNETYKCILLAKFRIVECQSRRYSSDSSYPWPWEVKILNEAFQIPRFPWSAHRQPDISRSRAIHHLFTISFYSKYKQQNTTEHVLNLSIRTLLHALLWQTATHVSNDANFTVNVTVTPNYSVQGDTCPFHNHGYPTIRKSYHKYIPEWNEAREPSNVPW